MTKVCVESVKDPLASSCNPLRSAHGPLNANKEDMPSNSALLDACALWLFCHVNYVCARYEELLSSHVTGRETHSDDVWLFHCDGVKMTTVTSAMVEME